MYISKSKNKYGKHYISIAKGVRDPETKKVKKIMIKGYGTHDLNSASGKKALALAEADLKEMIKLDEASKGFENFGDFILSMSKDKLSLNHKNIGYVPYFKIFNALKLPNFFSKLVKDTKLNYSFSDMMFYQVLGRLFDPGSKLEVATRKDNYLHNFNFVNKDNIYTSMDVFSGCNKHKLKIMNEGAENLRSMKNLLEKVDEEAKKILNKNIENTSKELKNLLDSYDKNFQENENKLFKHLNKHIDKIVPDRSMSLAFYDCTTYYFESFDEDGFRERGMSKDNKRNETQVVMGLLIDINGIPFSYKLFKGNEHELETMEDVIDDVLKNYTIKEIIIVADRGLNSRKNLEMIRSKELNYIVGSKSSAIPKALKEKKFDSSWNITSKASDKYKSGYITSKRTIAEKDDNYDELIIKKYSDLYKEREMMKQEQMLERAKNNMKDFTISSTTKSKSKYYKASDKAKEKIKVEIDEEKIQKERENFGYFYIITNKVEMDPASVMVAYKSLYKIEESFRILKTNLKARPVYHYKERRIRSHFLICYLALVIQRVLEYQLKDSNIQLSTHEIINGLNEFIVDEIDYKVDKLYMISEKVLKGKINKEIFKFEKNILLSNEISNMVNQM
jgi:transposase